MMYRDGLKRTGRLFKMKIRLQFQVAALFSAMMLTRVMAEAPELSLPLNCTIGESCFVQNLVDLDTGPAKQDPFCGSATYDGHKGTDIRVRDIAEMRIGVPVLAMADGRVTGIRNSAPEKLVETRADRRAVAGKECGNGLAIDHGGGWVTQLCHLAHGSVRVKRGDRVKRGQPVGRIGLSGFTAFPHVHVSVRKDGDVVDPMTGQKPGNACKPSGKGLWSKSAGQQLRNATAALLQTGFAGGPVTSSEVMKNKIRRPAENGPLVFFAVFINLQPGDRIELQVSSPEGVFAQSKTDPLVKPKATYSAYAGRKSGIPAGVTVTGTARLFRAGRVIVEKTGVEFSF